jgi:4-amino-4-deoxy-L-arabinose transferase-like glycosyltransferase
MRRVHRAAAVAVAIVLLSTLLTPLRRELYVGDETKYSQVVREMRTGSVFLPTLEGSPFTHKPPLHFWMIRALTVPFGVYSIWPFVIPSLLAFAALLWLLHRMGGMYAAFVGGTSLMIWGSAQTARMDLTFNALLVLAALMVERFFDREDFRALLWAAIATGFAALAKGPMAPVIILTLLLFEWLRRRRMPRGNYFLPLLAMLAVPLLWLVPAIVIGGENYWREIFFKQTVGRAVGAWVHKSPPWFYLTHAPADTAPWFLLLVVALVAVYKRSDARAKFFVNWLLAVLIPYSLLSSKLDVYMMALLPPVALIIARLLESEDRWWTWGRRANLTTLALFALIGIAGLFVRPEHIKGPDGALAALPSVKALFAVLLVAAVIGLVVSLRSRDLRVSTIATGLAPIAMFAYIAIALVPLANDMASTRPLVAAIQRQNVPAIEVACHVCPHLWIRGMPEELEAVRLVDAAQLTNAPRVIVTRRKDEAAIANVLRGYRKVDEFRMIGKWFDVYRR